MIDKNVKSVTDKMIHRSMVGLKKYGVTTERTDLTRRQWLTHAQEESMDFSIYLERVIKDEDELITVFERLLGIVCSVANTYGLYDDEKPFIEKSVEVLNKLKGAA